MSRHELTTIPNPRTDRAYRVTLSTDHPLPCKSADCDAEGLASFDLHYAPLELCIETRSFGWHLTHLLNSRALDQELLRQIVTDVMGCCHPATVEVNAQFKSADGKSIEFSSSSQEVIP